MPTVTSSLRNSPASTSPDPESSMDTRDACPANVRSPDPARLTANSSVCKPLARRSAEP